MIMNRVFQQIFILKKERFHSLEMTNSVASLKPSTYLPSTFPYGCAIDNITNAPEIIQWQWGRDLYLAPSLILNALSCLNLGLANDDMTRKFPNNDKRKQCLVCAPSCKLLQLTALHCPLEKCLSCRNFLPRAWHRKRSSRLRHIGSFYEFYYFSTFEAF